MTKHSSVLRLLLTISLAKTDEGTYKMSSEQLWNEFSTVHDIRKKYDLNDEGLLTDIGEVAKCFAYKSSPSLIISANVRPITALSLR